MKLNHKLEIMMSEQGFEVFGILELFGHQMIAGKVSEQVIAGKGFIRVDVPGTDEQEAFTKFYGPDAVYAITPTDEGTALIAAENLRKAPIETYKLNLPQLNARTMDEVEEEELF